MAYSTPALVRKALAPQVGDGTTVPDPLSNTAADLTNEQLDDAIAEADSIIDGYLAKRYATPVKAVEAAIPHPIDYWSRTLAAYLATCTYRGSMDFTDNDPIYRRFVQVMDLLKAVAKGDLALGLPTAGSASGEDGNATAGGATAAINPYIGTLFPASDFDVNGGVWPNETHGRHPYWM